MNDKIVYIIEHVSPPAADDPAMVVHLASDEQKALGWCQEHRNCLNEGQSYFIAVRQVDSDEPEEMVGRYTAAGQIETL